MRLVMKAVVLLLAMLVFAPYVNSYRRFLNPWDSPVNLAWAIDNRTVGLRVPDASPDARRVENRLAGADVLVEDKLFATLDPTTRRVHLPSGKRVLFTDTVGFISRLPHGLVESFKGTLEDQLGG